MKTKFAASILSLPAPLTVRRLAAGVMIAASVWSLITPALEAAEAAMRDRDHIARCQAENARMRAWLAEALAEKGVPSDTSCANFILARFADTAIAEACDEALKAQGLIVVGRTNMTEFAYSGLGLNPHYGTPGNAAAPRENVAVKAKKLPMAA